MATPPVPPSNGDLPRPHLLGPPMFWEEAVDQLIGNLDVADPSTRLTPNQIVEALEALPRLTELDVESLGHRDSMCPICFIPFAAIFAEEEMAIAMDSPAHPIESLGISKLPCAHLFCRKDVTQWIKDAHDSCPVCRGFIVPSRRLPTNVRDEPPAPSPSQDALDRLLRSYYSAPGGSDGRGQQNGMYS